MPLVVDADALNAFEADATSLADRKVEAVLTPHEGELARLLGASSVDRLADARALADAARAVALVKGTRRSSSSPAGTARVNPTGSTALATAGTGDVLTGAIGGLLAGASSRSPPPGRVPTSMGSPGLAAADRTGDGTVAADVADRLPDAIARVGEAP